MEEMSSGLVAIVSTKFVENSVIHARKQKKSRKDLKMLLNRLKNC
jgi:hypothetical protein